MINADPYADLEPDFDEHELKKPRQSTTDALLGYPPIPSATDWSPPSAVSKPVPVPALEALSAAASSTVEQLGFLSTINPIAQPLQREPSSQASDALNAMSQSTPQSMISSPDISIAALISQARQHPLPMVPSTGATPPIDPTLESASAGSPATRVATEANVESEHQTVYLLRHYAEVPGPWMDLFDLGQYFSQYVPVKAMANPLLKHAACAYASKQLSRVRGRKPLIGGICSRQAKMEQFAHSDKTDWEYIGAQHYDKAISLLMGELKENKSVTLNDTIDNQSPTSQGLTYYDPARPGIDRKRKAGIDNNGSPRESIHGTYNRKRRKLSTGKVSSDEMAAATAILCNYEFLDGSGAAWSRHLDGTKSLLDIAEGRMVPLLTPFVMPRPNISKSRRATFWNFARQDMLSALINETTQTRLDTEDLPMWKDAGLLLDENGHIRPSNIMDSGYPEGPSVMKEDMISNGLVWLIGKIINYCVAADTAPTRVGGNPQPWEGINQHTLMEKWRDLDKQLSIWADGLPDTFKPCAEISARPSSADSMAGNEGNVFTEVWFASPMCASTMQSYHMARMLLLINMPQHSTLGRTTAFQRMASYKSVAADTEYHSRAICSIAASRPDASARIHAVQPLFLAGQFLEKAVERAEILRLLKEIEQDTGWATEYRVKQLMEIWGWAMDGEAP